jgi:uncharacterized protein YdeI (YjbR/CyaY-like superfamily)
MEKYQINLYRFGESMTIVHALLLGIVQGLTEFIPVSSTAHMLMGQRLFGIPADDAMFSFLVIIQLGTLVSVFAFYWQDLIAITTATYHFRRSTPERNLGFYIILATIPALLAGYLLKDMVESLFRNPLLQASIRLFAAAILLTLAELLTRKNRDLGSMRWTDALFVGFYKKGVPKTSMTYAESVDEALCFGWIDGQSRRVDDEVYAIRFTPRRRTSNWSAINIAKIAELTSAGRMHPAGIRAFEERDRRKDAYANLASDAELGPGMVQRFKADADAWSAWLRRPPGFRRQATSWVLSARRGETRERRLTELIDAMRTGDLPAPFLVTRESRDRG